MSEEPEKKEKQKPDKNSEEFNVKVYSPFKVYYDGLAKSISAMNDTGPFDVLGKHHNFLTLLIPCEIIIRAEGKDDLRIKITRGIMQVSKDDVVVFLDV